MITGGAQLSFAFASDIALAKSGGFNSAMNRYATSGVMQPRLPDSRHRAQPALGQIYIRMWIPRGLVYRCACLGLRPAFEPEAAETEALNSGASLPIMQEQAGHANTTTTLSYARPADAKSRRLQIAF